MSRNVTTHPQLPERLINRFRVMKLRVPGREESTYGPINKLLGIIFSKEAHMIKPQGPIKEEAAELDVNDSFRDSEASMVANLSMVSENSSFRPDTPDSYGRPPAGKVTKFPDFIVCEFSASATEDKVILMIEVKKEAYQLRTGLEELREYLDMMGSKLESDLCVAHGVVIAGHRVLILAPNADSHKYEIVETFSTDLSVMDQEFLEYLYERASLTVPA